MKIPFFFVGKLLRSHFIQEVASRLILVRLIKNTVWISLDNVVRLGVSFIISLLLARQLGPEVFGEYQYLLAISVILTPLAKLGLDNLVLREFSRTPQHSTTILGTALALRLFSSGLLLLAVWGITLTDFFSSELQKQIILLLMICLTLQSFEVIESWFQSQLKVKGITFIRLCVFLIVGAIKVSVLIFAPSLLTFMMLVIIEWVFLALGSLWFYWKETKIRFSQWSWDSLRARSFLFTGWPIILSSFLVILLARADQLLITRLQGPNILAQFAVAIMVLETLSFLPVVVFKVSSPLLLATHETNERLFQQQLLSLYRVMTLLSLLLIFGVIAFIAPILGLFFGSDYPLLTVLVQFLSFRIFFTNFGIVRSIYITANTLFKYDLFAIGISVAVSIFLNILLIPHLGVYSLVLVGYISLLLSTFLIDMGNRSLRNNLRIALTGLFSAHRLRLERL